MSPIHSRRTFLHTSAVFIATGFALNGAAAADTNPTSSGGGQAPAKPPVLPGEKIQAVVVQAHRSLEKVRELVEEVPLLANASWDWGGGDFETPLEAAAHTGGHDIARYLLSKGARPSLFAAGMLGQLDLVKAFHAVDPLSHQIPGPHGFTLWHCVKKGGDHAKSVLEWLIAQGVSDVAMRPLPFVWPAGTQR